MMSLMRLLEVWAGPTVRPSRGWSQRDNLKQQKVKNRRTKKKKAQNRRRKEMDLQTWYALITL